MKLDKNFQNNAFILNLTLKKMRDKKKEKLTF